MYKILLRALFATTIAASAILSSPPLHAAEKIGVLMLHGKNPGGPQDPNFGVLKPKFEEAGMIVALPDMPWSRNRYIDVGWEAAMGEIEQHVKSLREKGATQIVLVGHSMGAPAALSHTARKGNVQALVLLAPGHIPYGYYTFPSLKAVRDSVDEARALVKNGKGDSKERFTDINQGRPQLLVMSAKDYLSYFDPESDAEMSVTAPRVPPAVPSLVVIGDKDPLFSRIRTYFVDKLPENPKNQYLEVQANHLTTPGVASDAIIDWVKKSVTKD